MIWQGDWSSHPNYPLGEMLPESFRSASEILINSITSFFESFIFLIKPSYFLISNVLNCDFVL